MDDDYTPQEVEAAYGAAAKAGDTAAMADLHSRRMAMVKPIDPTADMSGTDKFTAGVGHAFQRGAEGLANLVGIKGGNGVVDSTDQGLKDEDKTAQPLLSTGAGKAGDIAGQVVESLPLGMGVGAGVRSLASPLGRTVARLAASGGENALQSAAFADPDQQGGDAAKGGALGAGLSAAGGVVGRTLGGLVKKSALARSLGDSAAAQGKDLFVPVSQGADSKGLSGAIKAIYRDAVPYAIGAGGKLAKQSDEAAQTLRETAALRNSNPALRGNLVGDTTEQTMANLEDNQQAQRAALGRHVPVEVPDSFASDVSSNIQKTHGIPATAADPIAQAVDSAVDKYTTKGKGAATLTAENLQRARTLAKANLDKLGPDITDEMKGQALDGLDNLADESLAKNQAIAKPILAGAKVTKGPGGRFRAFTPDEKNAPKNAEDLAGLQQLEDRTPEVEALKAASDSSIAQKGNFPMATAARLSPSGDQRKLFQDATEVLENQPSGHVSPGGRHLLHAGGAVVGLGALGMGHPGVAAAVGAGILGGNALASRGVQRALYGDSKFQKTLADFIRNHPRTSDAVGAGTRAAINE